MMGQKRVRKLCPCHAYDIEGIESWLSDMAANGLILDKEVAILAGFFPFKKEEPQKCIYRLDPAPYRGNFLTTNIEKPGFDEQVEIARACGWEYILHYADFYIYCTTDLEARELNTDSDVQAFAINVVKKRQRFNLIFYSIWLLLQTWILGWRDMVLSIFDVGVGVYIFLTLLFVWIFTSHITEVVHLGRLQRQLEETGHIDHNKKWKYAKNKYWILKSAQTIYVFFCITYFICIIYAQENIVRTDIQFYDKELPFASLNDICGVGEYTESDSEYGWMEQNTYYEWDNLISIYNIEWTQNGVNEYPDGTSVEYGYDVRYYELESEWMANLGAKKFTKYYTRKNYFSDYTYYQETTAPDVDVDYIRTYRGLTMENMCIIQDGNILIVASLYQDSQEGRIDVEEWIASLVETI